MTFYEVEGLGVGLVLLFLVSLLVIGFFITRADTRGKFPIRLADHVKLVRHFGIDLPPSVLILPADAVEISRVSDHWNIWIKRKPEPELWCDWKWEEAV